MIWNDETTAILRKLSDTYGIIAVKAEFEAEGSRFDELCMLNAVIRKENLKFFIKIGGCEAMRDLEECRMLGANAVIAPMTESLFAVRKFSDAISKVYSPEERKNKEFIINAETVTTYQNFKDILSGLPEHITGVNVGLVDLTESIGLSRNDVHCSQISKMAIDLISQASAKGLSAGLGGGLSVDSADFLKNACRQATRFETRKIVFDYHKVAADLQNAIILASKFEYYYLKAKQEHYKRISREDSQRIEMLKSRIV